ncbi:MAG: DUF151 domain-containing protein [bacterium]|nr:DUF151 domain-containing protein [bacterium]
MVEMIIDIERTIHSLRPDNGGGQQTVCLRSKEDDRLLPIVIGRTEALSIYAELTGEQPLRPLTHDLLRNILDRFGARVDEVRIVALRDQIFYAELRISRGNRQLSLDARPSDSIALALRYSAPIYMAEEVLQEAGYSADSMPEETELPIPEWAIPGPEADEEETMLEVEELLNDVEPARTRPRHTLKEQIDQLKTQMEQATREENYEEAGRLRDEITKLTSRKK